MLSHTWEVGETPTDPTGTPTYAIVDANGDAVASGDAAIVGDGTGQVTAGLDGQPAVALLTVTWTATVGGVTVSEVDMVEIVGAFFFTLAQARGSDDTLKDPLKYPTADLEAKRTEVEVECEEICARAFVRRYRRVVLDGTGSPDLVLPDMDVRTIRRAAVANRADGSFVDLTVGQLAALAVTGDNTVRRVDDNTWTEGTSNVVFEYEVGMDAPPADLVTASMERHRTRLQANRSGVPDRATSFTIADGGIYRLDLPGAYKVGIPSIDAVYGRYSLRPGAGPGTGGGQAVPASRTMVYQPQRGSMFHQRWPR